MSELSYVKSGLVADRPSADPLMVGRLYWATDTRQMFRDDGSAWECVVDTDAEGTVASMRTLGASASRAAPGDHIHRDLDWNLHSDNVKPTGITWANGYFYVVDRSDLKVYVYDADGNHQSDRDFNLIRANNYPAGITWDGTYFYVTDLIDEGVYVYNADGTSQSDRNFNLVGVFDPTPHGITWDGTYLYVADGTYDKVRVCDPTHITSPIRWDLGFELHSGNTGPVGITWDGTYLYVVDQTGDKVYVYDRDGNHQSTRDFDLTTDNGLPQGITWDGTHFYVVDYTNRKVYVYDTDGNHVG